MKLREREYRSRFDRRERVNRIVPESDRMPIDFRRIMFKWGPWAVGAAVVYWAFTTYVI